MYALFRWMVRPLLKTGAGMLPYCKRDGRVYVLLHETLEGKKQGFLMDWGGSLEATDGSDLVQCAIREFTEEMECVWLLDDGQLLEQHRGLNPQLLADHCQKMREYFVPGRTVQLQNLWYDMFLVEVPWKPLDSMNSWFEQHAGTVHSKQRILKWVAVDEIDPERLFVRVRNLWGLQEALASL